MKKVVIGIQGDIGSTNERACLEFAKKHVWAEFEIKYLITTERVLEALEKGEIDYGTFAWESRAGIVKESEEAAKRFNFNKVDEVNLTLDHALLKSEEIDKSKTVQIYSHPQALKEHKSFLEKEFPNLELVEDIDTAVAASKLSQGEYPDNSLIIAPIACAEIYGLGVYMSDLPTNQGYWVIIYLASRSI